MQEEFEDTKGVIRIRKKGRQHNGQEKKDEQRSTKRTPLKTGGELRCSGEVPAPLMAPVVLI